MPFKAKSGRSFRLSISSPIARFGSATMLTQVVRALGQLGIEHIAAYSLQARGRSERVGTVEAANTWLRDRFIADYNTRFAVGA
jgi:hypothetical protein